MIQNYIIGKGIKNIKLSLDKYNNEEKIHTIISNSLNFDLLPRNSDGYCIHNGLLSLDRKDMSLLPDKLIVYGSLWCKYNVNLTSLPNDLKVYGDLECYHCSIKTIGNDIYVQNDFDCRINLIEKLPDSLMVGGNLIIMNNKIQGDIDNVIVGGRIYK